MFSKGFEQFVSLNLDLLQDRKNWEGDPTCEQLLRNIEISKGIRIFPGKTLLFIDEIQNDPRAIQSLRYLYEQKPDLHVIATGSLMEVALKNKGFSFPVGRVSFLYLYPLQFDEFLQVQGHQELLEELQSLRWIKAPSQAVHSMASDHFCEYLFLGGMPEVIRRYAEEKSHLLLTGVKEGLLTSFEGDVPKYARPAHVAHIQFLIRQAPLFAGQRIQYANFAHSGYPGREMREAFEILEQAMITERILGTNQTILPMQPQLRVSPKLLYLDVGLVSHRLAVDLQSLKRGDLNDLFRGTIAEQIVGQELIAQNALRREAPLFWCRNKAGSEAETDYCISLKGLAMPIEVKSGKSGRLRSLLQFMEQAPHAYATRIYSGPLQTDTLTTSGGKQFTLLSVPFYLTFRLREILEDWVGAS